MSVLNKKFPQILMAYVNDQECTLSNNDCNELSKFVSGIELERDAITAENKRLREALEKIINWEDSNDDSYDLFSAGEIARAALSDKEVKMGAYDDYLKEQMKNKQYRFWYRFYRFFSSIEIAWLRLIGKLPK